LQDCPHYIARTLDYKAAFTELVVLKRCIGFDVKLQKCLLFIVLVGNEETKHVPSQLPDCLIITQALREWTE